MSGLAARWMVGHAVAFAAAAATPGMSRWLETSASRSIVLREEYAFPSGLVLALGVGLAQAGVGRSLHDAWAVLTAAALGVGTALGYGARNAFWAFLVDAPFSVPYTVAESLGWILVGSSEGLAVAAVQGVLLRRSGRAWAPWSSVVLLGWTMSRASPGLLFLMGWASWRLPFRWILDVGGVAVLAVGGLLFSVGTWFLLRRLLAPRPPSP